MNLMRSLMIGMKVMHYHSEEFMIELNIKG